MLPEMPVIFQKGGAVGLPVQLLLLTVKAVGGPGERANYGHRRSVGQVGILHDAGFLSHFSFRAD